MVRKSTYRLGRRLKSSAKARLDYITYLNSDGMATRQRAPINPDLPVERRLEAYFGFGGAMAGSMRLNQFVGGAFGFGGALRANIYPPLTLQGRFGLGGALTAGMDGVPKQLQATMALGGTFKGGMSATASLGVSFGLGGGMRDPFALRSFMALGGVVLATPRIRQIPSAAVGLGGAFAADVAAGPVYDADAQAVMDAMVTSPTLNRRTAINDLVVALKGHSLWSKFDTLHIFHANAEQSALVNWKSPAGADGTNNGLTFVTNDCFTRTASAQKVTVPFAPGTGQFMANSATIGVYAKDDGLSDNRYISCNHTAGVFLTLTLRSTPDMQAAINDALSDTFSRVAGNGLYAASRTASSVKRLQKNNTVLGTAGTVSTSVPTATLLHVFDGAGGSGGSAKMAFTASGMTQAEVNNLANDLNAFFASAN